MMKASNLRDFTIGDFVTARWPASHAQILGYIGAAHDGLLGLFANGRSEWINSMDIIDLNPCCPVCEHVKWYWLPDATVRCGYCLPPLVNWPQFWRSVERFLCLTSKPYSREVQRALELCDHAFTIADYRVFQRGLAQLQWFTHPDRTHLSVERRRV